jgi:ABC-type oligopeptide transport system ATPase subunit
MVARALLLKPKLIVADEPVSMVDASLRATILGSSRRLADEYGISILYITHDLATATARPRIKLVAPDRAEILSRFQHVFATILI